LNELFTEEDSNERGYAEVAISRPPMEHLFPLEAFIFRKWKELADKRPRGNHVHDWG
jgi:hypothetical protein